MGFGKGNDACQYVSATTAGVVASIGTGPIDLYGIYRGSDLAGTISVTDSATALFTMSADRYINFATPIAFNGPFTMTSSAGRNFVIAFRKRG